MNAELRRGMSCLSTGGVATALAGLMYATACHRSLPTELKDYFLRKRLDWRGGDRAVPIHSKLNSKLRNAFVKRVLQMTPSEEDAFWRDKKIRTGVAAPAEFSNTLKAVFKIAGSVSYVFRSQYREGVAKVVLVIPAE